MSAEFPILQVAGKVYLEIDRFFPSSKTCNHCLNVVESLPLNIRQWECSCCGTKHGSASAAASSTRYQRGKEYQR